MRVLFIFTSTFSAVALTKRKITVISNNKCVLCWIERATINAVSFNSLVPITGNISYIINHLIPMLTSH